MTSDQSFGGDWTEAKLQVLRGYLSAYTRALRKTPFRKVYIDAFAGTGYRRPRPGMREPENQGELFPDLAAHPPQALIAATWQDKLDAFLGTAQWRESLYRRQQEQTSLFGSGDDVRIKATVDEIGRFFLDRLRTVFPGVAPEPGVLRNSRNSPLFLFCFGAANERGAPIALRIAAHLLQELR